jgi:hypothetical protein
MVGCPTTLSLFLVDVDNRFLHPATKDVILRVDVKTGKADLAWLVEKDIMALSMTSHGHVAASWSDRVVEYTTDGRQLRTHQIPQIAELVPKETIPLPDGGSLIINWCVCDICRLKFQQSIID